MTIEIRKRTAVRMAGLDTRTDPMISRSKMKALIADAERAGCLHDLYYWIMMQVPSRLRRDRQDDGLTAAEYPGGWIPVIPCSPDAELGEALAGILCGSFVHDNPKDFRFIVQLTTASHMQRMDVRHYIWGDTVIVDAICAICASVRPVAHTLLEDSPAWLCAECAEG